ncbi:hypothetical protein PHMEG_0003083 [Phytophthora megakarya]|uniref:Reverse transcriptase Ty1/copia-type domain-containing protein n=1 Tax=Phytophthora megakarya TaxID=4795 RepID=A0A225WWW6_9STRA|nr:hypothetical protein PHMEG_0003083 [Phytophthora megakarya]
MGAVSVDSGDAIPPQHDESEEVEMVPSIPMTTRSRTRSINETTEPEEGGTRKKQVVAPSAIRTKKQKMIQERTKPTENQLAIIDGQAMAATLDVPKSYSPQTRPGSWCQDRNSPASNQLPFGVCLDEQREETSYQAQGMARSEGVLTTKRDVRACGVPQLHLREAIQSCAEGFAIERCDVDTVFLYEMAEAEIYVELPEELRELLTLADAEGEDNVVCWLVQILYGLKQASRV